MEQMVSPGRKLLVVDDDNLILRMLADLFQSELPVVTVENGASALSIIESEPLSAVLCDQMMPRMSGIEVLRECLRLQPHAARILMTASDKVQDVSDAVNLARVHRFIIKPFRTLEVMGIVKGAIHEVQLERENELLVQELQDVIGQVRARERELERELDIRTRELKDFMDMMRKE
jgi:response regulator RpfG family c-di-GMP phosphodiesterase